MRSYCVSEIMPAKGEHTLCECVCVDESDSKMLGSLMPEQMDNTTLQCLICLCSANGSDRAVVELMKFNATVFH